VELRVLEVEPFGERELLDRLAQVRLVGHGRPRVYEDAELDLIPAMDTDRLAPAQRYVLRGNVRRILALREALLGRGIDVFALDGGAYVTTSDDPGERVPVIPPVVEESHEPDGRTVLVINDGIHRAYAARSLGLPISVVVVRGVPREYPYYALALRDGWAGMEELDELPDDYRKKEYRRPDDHKALFRDFNAVFPGVQEVRKATNPERLRA
jgi:hypothetical protein